MVVPPGYGWYIDSGHSRREGESKALSETYTCLVATNIEGKSPVLAMVVDINYAHSVRMGCPCLINPRDVYFFRGLLNESSIGFVLVRRDDPHRADKPIAVHNDTIHTQPCLVYDFDLVGSYIAVASDQHSYQ